MRWVDTDSVGNLKKFDNVKAAFASLVFRHERLWSGQFPCQINLGKARRVSGLNQKEAETFVVFREDRFRH
jgi:hypothetical protein